MNTNATRSDANHFRLKLHPLHCGVRLRSVPAFRNSWLDDGWVVTCEIWKYNMQMLIMRLSRHLLRGTGRQAVHVYHLYFPQSALEQLNTRCYIGGQVRVQRTTRIDQYRSARHTAWPAPGKRSIKIGPTGHACKHSHLYLLISIQLSRPQCPHEFYLTTSNWRR